MTEKKKKIERDRQRGAKKVIGKKKGKKERGEASEEIRRKEEKRVIEMEWRRKKEQKEKERERRKKVIKDEREMNKKLFFLVFSIRTVPKIVHM